MQELVAPDMTVGLQIRDLTPVAAASMIAADCDVPLYAALTDPLWFDEKEAALRVNPAELSPAPTDTVCGALSMLLTVDIDILAPPAGAALVRVTVQELDDDGPMVDGLQASEETATVAERLTVAVAELLL